MYWANQIIAGWLSLALFHLPEFDYWGHYWRENLHCRAIANIPGV